jgi:DNA-binding transcriptional ArsR family regulator
MTPAELLRLLLDPDRLAVAGALASRRMTTKEVVDATGRNQRVVLTAIGDLRAAGLVTVDGDQYAIDPAALRDAARATAELDVPMDPIIGYGMTDDEQAILRRFFAGRTITEIPANRAKRQVLLQRLALEFNVGQRYTEREVNEILFAFHPDWSTLRRYLVDEGFLDREHADDQNWYWRAGGRVTDLPSGGPDQ